MPAIEALSIAGLEPARIVPGARFTVRGAGFPIDSVPSPSVAIGDQPARLVFGSRQRLVVEAPDALDGGRLPVIVAGAGAPDAFVDVGAVVATGVHQVDSPRMDRAGHVYATFSGSRGQESIVSIFRVGPDGAREAFVSGIINATSLAFGPEETLYVSSRFDGTVSRVYEDGRPEVVASDLGRACGLAFAPDGTLFVGDRSGTIFHLDLRGSTKTFATLPPSVAAFHLAMGPDEHLYVTAPTLAPRDRVYRIDSAGRVEPLPYTFGRPQGLAFGPDGVLHVVEALAGASAVYRLPASGAPQLTVAGRGLVGVTFGPSGQMLVCSSDTIYSF